MILSTGSPVSTLTYLSILQGFTEEEIDASFSLVYAQKGGYFVGFALPTTALFYDTVTERWHERKSRIVDSRGVTSTVRFRVNSIVSAFGRLLVGDSIDGRIEGRDIPIYFDNTTMVRAETHGDILGRRT